jgi:hypothetical protein
VYEVTLTVEDDDTGTDQSVFQYIVIFDPTGGFVTGGGWFDSPARAYMPDPLLTGKASFGFVAKYKPGTNGPNGHTEFQFKVADLNFQSNDYDWLVVAGAHAKFKGTGTINGENTLDELPYKFQIWAGDGTGPDGVDTFRIKIWYEDEYGVETVVYDNRFEGSGFENGQPISGGSIIVHNKK